MKLQDPGNLGTILRASLGLAISVYIAYPNSVDPVQPKSKFVPIMGALFHVAHWAEGVSSNDLPTRFIKLLIWTYKAAVLNTTEFAN